jgi:Flp pilus assembly secretin CpaC
LSAIRRAVSSSDRPGHAGTFGHRPRRTRGSKAVNRWRSDDARCAGKLFGLDLIGSLDLAAKDGLVTILAEPNLTALSGETASFLAGGEFPVPISQASARYRSNISNMASAWPSPHTCLPTAASPCASARKSARLSNGRQHPTNGFNVPALTTRRAETTVELGSGRSFMIAGLLRDSHTNDVTKAPFLGDLPILGALFPVDQLPSLETELVIIVTRRTWSARVSGQLPCRRTAIARRPTSRAWSVVILSPEPRARGRRQPRRAPHGRRAGRRHRAPGFKL